MKHKGYYSKSTVFAAELEMESIPGSEHKSYIEVIDARPLRNHDGAQAMVLTLKNGWTVLQSYSTIVSYYDGKDVYHLGKWSVTTSRQQTWFDRDHR